MPGSVELFTKNFFKQPPDLPPGKVVPVTDRIRLPANMPTGTYRLSVGIVSDTSRKPIARLGIKGRTEQGWYPLSWLPIRR